MNEYTLEQFDRYPVYGTRVTALLDLLASIAIRVNNENPASQSSEEEPDGH